MSKKDIQFKTPLSELQLKVFNALLPSGRDHDIAVVYCRVYGIPTGTITLRDMQQKLAPAIVEVNLKLENGLIELGDLKRTYRLSKTLLG